MDNNLKQEAIKEAEDYWEKNLKENFKTNLNTCLAEALKNIKNELKNFDESMKSYIQSLQINFEENFNFQCSQLQKQIGNDDNNDNNNIFNNDIIQNNLNNNNNNNVEKNNNNNFDNKFNNNVNDNNNNDIESDEMLRKIKINFNAIAEPPLKNIILPINSNPLINLIFNSLVNIRHLLLYYMNPTKEEKIMKKSNGINNILGPVFLKLIDHSWKSKFNEYTPEKMHQILKNLMKGDYNTQNPGLIYKYILSQLHSELCPNELNNGNIEKDPYLKYNEDKVFEDFQKNYQNTKISNCLYNIIKTQKRCEGCGTIQYSMENLPIIDIFLQANENDKYNNISFKEHFNSLLLDKEEEIVKEDCIICNIKKDKVVSKNLYYSSDLIIININRDKDPNNLVQFNYPEVFEKKDIINDKNDKSFKNIIYEIFCVIKKDKANNNSQFKLFCKNFINNQWYSYDNRNIKISNLNEAISDSRNTYLIIYKNKLA